MMSSKLIYNAGRAEMSSSSLILVFFPSPFPDAKVNIIYIIGAHGNLKALLAGRLSLD
jgi:hypothetical protein